MSSSSVAGGPHLRRPPPLAEQPARHGRGVPPVVRALVAWRAPADGGREARSGPPSRSRSSCSPSRPRFRRAAGSGGLRRVVLTARTPSSYGSFSPPPVRRPIGYLMAALCAAVGVAYVAQVLIGWVAFWTTFGLAAPPLRPGFAGLTFGNPSAVMTVTVLLWLAAAGGLGTATRARVVVLGARPSSSSWRLGRARAGSRSPCPAAYRRPPGRCCRSPRPRREPSRRSESRHRAPAGAVVAVVGVAVLPLAPLRTGCRERARARHVRGRRRAHVRWGPGHGRRPRRMGGDPCVHPRRGAGLLHPARSLYLRPDHGRDGGPREPDVWHRCTPRWSCRSRDSR